MSPADLLVPIRVLMFITGAIMVMLAAGVWIETRRYPKPVPPADRTEFAISSGFFTLGALFVSLGVWWPE